MVKGLAKFGNRMRHSRTAKYVDACPFVEGRLLPNDAADCTLSWARRFLAIVSPLRPRNNAVFLFRQRQFVADSGRPHTPLIDCPIPPC